jgi:hypothetical protein
MTLRSRRLLCSVLLGGFSVVLGGCASIGPVRPVEVSDVKSLSGTWEGTVFRPGLERDDITLTIRDNGSYDVVSKKNVGASSGRGHIVVSDGRLVVEGERGRGVGTVLRSPAGNVLMKVDMTLSDNSNLSAELWRTR